jgi:glutamate-ammonia-ligase adenylyltransferase
LNPAWKSVVKSAPDPARAGHSFQLLADAIGGSRVPLLSPAQKKTLAVVFSASEVLSASLISHPDWLHILASSEALQPRRKQGLRGEVITWIADAIKARDYNTALKKVRELKQREMLRIGASDLLAPGRAPEITQALSDVADVCLEAVWDVCWAQLTGKLAARPWHQDADGNWRLTAGCILGMGKLGGQELNYSSDIDVLFVYSEEGGVFKETPRKSSRPLMPSHQFFKRLCEACIAEIGRMSAEGPLYRIDLRLRPEGDLAPLARSLSSYENYYAQWGQTWERMMLIKARGVAGDAALAAEFLEMVQPFRYPRSMNPGVLREVAAMKDRIENEVVRSGELDRNVKLGRGGIREIEFVAQSLQLLHAGRQPFLQTPQTLPCLQKLSNYELLKRDETMALTRAYCFLRDVEHRLQMDKNLQTHTIRQDQGSQERLARLMGFRTLKLFEAAHSEHRKRVRAIFDRILKPRSTERKEGELLPQTFDADGAEWKPILEEHGFVDLDKAYRVLREFVEGPGYVHVSHRTVQLAQGLLPTLLALCPVAKRKSMATTAKRKPTLPSSLGAPLSDPDRVLTRLDSFITAYGARATMFELWHSNPPIFELLVLLFDRSEFLAELAIHVPDMVDDLVTSGRLRQRKTAADTLSDLRHGISDADQHLWLRRYHQTERMRIGLRDILGLSGEDQYLAELSALAEACLQFALESVMRKHKLKHPPFSIFGLGKLGGAEIDYGSDLDMLFVAPDSAKNLPKLTTIARDVMDLLSRRTELGIVFEPDARLRPDGEKGLLVNGVSAFSDYYRERAVLWEIQALSRCRFIAGDAKTGAAFQNIVTELADFREPRTRLAAYSEDWKQKIYKMRMRIEKERTPAGKDHLAIKTGSGGLVDAEFIAQALCLEHGWHEPNTRRALQRASTFDKKHFANFAALIDGYTRLRRLEGILRRWSYEGETVLPDDPAPYRRVSIRCGFKTPEEFARAVATWRAEIRNGYEWYFV